MIIDLSYDKKLVKMETKQIFLMSIALAMLIGTASAQYDQSLTLANLSVQPNPVVAGGNVTIGFHLYNGYGFGLYGTTLQASSAYPLFNESMSESIIGLVNPGLNPTNYSYTFHIPSVTPSGTYTINFVAQYLVYAATGTVVATSQLPVTFYVENWPSIKLVPAQTQPATLYTGHNQTLALVVENIGYGDARNVSVDVSAGKGLSILSPVTTFFISNLTQGSSASESLLVGAQSLNSTYLLANISYYSSQFQRRFSSLQRINLSIAPSAQFTISSVGSGAPVGAADVPVSIEITNTGTSTASELGLTLETTYPISPVSSTAYVADLQPGASANLTFLVDVDSAGVPGNYPVTLYEQWKQPNGAENQQFAGSNNYSIPVVSAGVGTIGLVIGAIVVIVIIVAIIVFRRRRSKKAENHKGKK